MSGETRATGLAETSSWVGWCCSYCAAPLEAHGHGLLCRAETRWFATQDGVHRLLTEERRRELLPTVEMHQRVRRDEGWRAEPGLPDVSPGHPLARAWQSRAARFRQARALAAARLGPGPWRVLDAGAGCCWTAIGLLEDGHRVAAVDVNVDAEDGLRGAERVSPRAAAIDRAEAEMEALPAEPASFDLVLAAASLHYAPHLTRTLVELRRVTRRGGVLVAFDSPVFRRRSDGEATVAERMRAQARRYSVPLDRDGQPGYFVGDELPSLFRTAGWSVEVHDAPGRGWQWVQGLKDVLRHGRRAARFPILLARRDG
jgi:SAM-dependent methyltransferase